ncbi:MAG: hypothetical protein J3Q66DRAFT_321417, partial [Benniella sp.]
IALNGSAATFFFFLTPGSFPLPPSLVDKVWTVLRSPQRTNSIEHTMDKVTMARPRKGQSVVPPPPPLPVPWPCPVLCATRWPCCPSHKAEPKN